MFFADPERIGVLLIKSIYEAHLRTCVLTTEQIHEQWLVGVDQSMLFAFKNMVSNLCNNNKKFVKTHFTKKIICNWISSFFLNYWINFIFILFTVSRGSMAKSSSSIDKHYKTNYWVCQNGTRLYEIQSGWPDCPAEKG